MTVTERRLLRTLEDGRPHSADELRLLCLNDHLSGSTAMHISNLRKKLLPDGFRVVFEDGSYRLVKFLNSALH